MKYEERFTNRQLRALIKHTKIEYSVTL